MIKMNINENVFIQFGQLMTYQGTLGAISGIHCHSGGQSGISGSLRCCQEHYGQAQNLICLCQSRILFSKYLRTLKSHRNGFVFKICIWISVFRRKKRFENPIFGCRDIKQTPSLIFFGTPCRSQILTQNQLRVVSERFLLNIFVSCPGYFY